MTTNVPRLIEIAENLSKDDDEYLLDILFLLNNIKLHLSNQINRAVKDEIRRKESKGDIYKFIGLKNRDFEFEDIFELLADIEEMIDVETTVVNHKGRKLNISNYISIYKKIMENLKDRNDEPHKIEPISLRLPVFATGTDPTKFDIGNPMSEISKRNDKILNMEIDDFENFMNISDDGGGENLLDEVESLPKNDSQDDFLDQMLDVDFDW